MNMMPQKILYFGDLFRGFELYLGELKRGIHYDLVDVVLYLSSLSLFTPLIIGIGFFHFESNLSFERWMFFRVTIHQLHVTISSSQEATDLRLHLVDDLRRSMLAKGHCSICPPGKAHQAVKLCYWQRWPLTNIRKIGTCQQSMNRWIEIIVPKSSRQAFENLMIHELPAQFFSLCVFVGLASPYLGCIMLHRSVLEKFAGPGRTWPVSAYLRCRPRGSYP